MSTIGEPARLAERDTEPKGKNDDRATESIRGGLGGALRTVEPAAVVWTFSVRQSVTASDRAAQLDLRYRVLREPLGMSREQAVFARDDDPDTVHLLAVAHDQDRILSNGASELRGEASALGVAGPGHEIGSAEFGAGQSKVLAANTGSSGASGSSLVVIGTATMITHGLGDVQLRGMATDSAWAGCGVGRAVLETAHALAGSRSLWCDARMSAHDFYARFGWVAEGEQFDIPQVGPHTVMRYQGTPT